MEILRLFAGILLVAIVVLCTRFAVLADAWRSAVFALHLRWEREQRQAGANGVTLAQRQLVQTEFEQHVANRPTRLLWIHLVLGIAAVGYALLLAWSQDDLRQTGLWLALPLGLIAAAMLGFAWTLINQANVKLTTTSSSLYGPAPPRVKVRAIQNLESDTVDVQ